MLVILSGAKDPGILPGLPTARKRKQRRASQASHNLQRQGTRAPMHPYQDLSGHSGVTAFQPGPDYIDIEFRDGKRYRYTHSIPGRQEVETMKILAAAGRHLATFINQHISERFANRLR